MITKLDPIDIVNREIMVSKINEMIDEINRLGETYENHYHETLDTHYNTTGPKESV